jgi:hypothetical protein
VTVVVAASAAVIASRVMCMTVDVNASMDMDVGASVDVSVAVSVTETFDDRSASAYRRVYERTSLNQDASAAVAVSAVVTATVVMAVAVIVAVTASLVVDVDVVVSLSAGLCLDLDLFLYLDASMNLYLRQDASPAVPASLVMPMTVDLDAPMAV